MPARAAGATRAPLEGRDPTHSVSFSQRCGPRGDIAPAAAFEGGGAAQRPTFSCSVPMRHLSLVLHPDLMKAKRSSRHTGGALGGASMDALRRTCVPTAGSCEVASRDSRAPVQGQRTRCGTCTVDVATSRRDVLEGAPRRHSQPHPWDEGRPATERGTPMLAVGASHR